MFMCQRLYLRVVPMVFPFLDNVKHGTNITIECMRRVLTSTPRVHLVS